SRPSLLLYTCPFQHPPTPAISTLSLHDALPISNDDARVRVALGGVGVGVLGELLEAHDLLGEIALRGKCLAHQLFPSLGDAGEGDRKSTRLNSSHVAISYAVFCLKKKKSSTKTC